MSLNLSLRRCREQMAAANNPAVAQPERSLAGGQGTRGRTHRRSLPPGQRGQIRLAAAQFLGRLSWQRAMLRVPVAGTGTPGRRLRPPRKCCSSVPGGQAAVGAKATRKEAGRRRSWRRRLRAAGLAVPTLGWKLRNVFCLNLGSSHSF